MVNVHRSGYFFRHIGPESAYTHKAFPTKHYTHAHMSNRSSFTAPALLNAEQISRWKLPKRFRCSTGIYGDGGKYTIAANVGNHMRIFEIFTTQKEAMAVIDGLKESKDPILSVLNLYIMTIDNWVPVPFVTSDDTKVSQSDSALNPFQAHLDKISADAAMIQRRVEEPDKDEATQANDKENVYDTYVEKIQKLAEKYVRRALQSSEVRQVLGNTRNVEQIFKGALSKLIDDGSGVIMSDFKLQQKQAKHKHTDYFGESHTKSNPQKKAILDTWRLAQASSK